MLQEISSLLRGAQLIVRPLWCEPEGKMFSEAYNIKMYCFCIQLFQLEVLKIQDEKSNRVKVTQVLKFPGKYLAKIFTKRSNRPGSL